MAGGNWSTTDTPVLPGLYMNFQAAATAAVAAGSQGIVAVPVKAHWGPIRAFVEIGGEPAIAERFGGEDTNGATAYDTLRLALLGKPKLVLAYRIADEDAAKATATLKDSAALDVLRLTALYEGARGNDFKATVQVNPVDALKKDIKLYEGAKLLRTFTFTSGTVQAAVDAVNGDAGNKWVTAAKLASGSGTLANVSLAPLAGGNSGIAGIAGADYTGALDAMETQTFHVVALDGVTDPAIQAAVAAWVSRVRGEGKGVIAVLGGSSADDTASDAVSKAATRSAGLNHEGVVNVGVGAVLGGVSYSSAQIAGYVAGLIAGQRLNESTTYAPSPFSDVTRRWTRSEQEQAVRSGVFLLVHDGRFVKGLRGINTLTALREGQNAAWRKIRTVRVMDAISGDLLRTAEDSYIGKVNNTDVGRLALLGAAEQYMASLAQAGVIEASDYAVALDPDYYGETAVHTPEPDQVYIRWQARLTDVMEQIFGTFIVN
ncbi:phage tail sheath subtilisin-like domain-containing protein [Paenibacillus cymbidii]|uniref:phage tail sheath subtilisin-like domain-containing protein n=1 Tax=Paenibacillus cymbidii TaxID=1639034 RepID=UPI001080A03D|nr:phage tail sheath subtilisin-like domain-containing protein [Paenibacillus cymbidii]